MLICRPIPFFDKRDLVQATRAFESAVFCSLKQHWQAIVETNFAPGIVRIGWQGNRVLIMAGLTDYCVCTCANAMNQKLWEVGDTFEVFLRPLTQVAYTEIQVSPNNHRLHLQISNKEKLQAARTNDAFASLVVDGGGIYSQTWCFPQKHRWFVLLEIPAGFVCCGDRQLQGAEWLFSFGRYDYSSNEKSPIISSTSLHAVADFHRQQEWGGIRFVK